MTRNDAMTARHAQVFYHVKARNADGSAARCRVNGACKTWKTRPTEFRLPVKYGLKACFYITERNAADWLLNDPTEEPTEADLDYAYRVHGGSKMS